MVVASAAVVVDDVAIPSAEDGVIVRSAVIVDDIPLSKAVDSVATISVNNMHTWD